MDAFSQMIIDAVDKTKNAVVKINVFRNDKTGKLRPAGAGSGFVFSSDGLVFTNSHVVENADKVMVSLLNENEIEGCSKLKNFITDEKISLKDSLQINGEEMLVLALAR